MVDGDTRDFINRMRARSDQRREEINAWGNAAQMQQMLARGRVIAAAAYLVSVDRTINPAEADADVQAAQDRLDEAVLAYAKALNGAGP
jgi:predicted RNase H-like nuclease